MSIDPGRVRAVFRKELRQFRRNRAIVATMGILPVLFLTGPMINIFSQTDQVASSGVNSTSMRIAGPCHTSENTACAAHRRTATTKATYSTYVTATAGSTAASPLPSISSPRRTGVVSSGSRVP